ncbi:MAG: hypothetical protein H6509_04300 [Bryobacterales bacterium]|nr:hypothetical protein [Acidobacteriota bacterium]MCB9383814.1 hypothetical protein [Bryobacterales bacterium]
MVADLIPIPPSVEVSEHAQAPRLTPIQRQAILALVECASVAEAAEAVGKSARTLHRWLRQSAFRQTLDLMLEARESAIAAELQNHAGLAIETLAALAANNWTKDGPRVQACRHLLEYGERRLERVRKRSDSLRS